MYDINWIEAEVYPRKEDAEFEADFDFSPLVAEAIFTKAKLKDVNMMLVVALADITKAKVTIDKKFKFKESKKLSSMNFRNEILNQRTELLRYFKESTELSLTISSSSSSLFQFCLGVLDKPYAPKLVSIESKEKLDDGKFDKQLVKLGLDLNDFECLKQ
mmetsp:Transcript_16624/g.19227  ORF Transcript_16624/g.19227 Transcript_16624/m.19227 type:complete len:160 (-) Transcript_16624:181-660(-)